MDKTKEAVMEVIDDEEFARQDLIVRGKVAEAAVELVLQMMELQKEDQKKERIRTSTEILNNIGSSKKSNLRQKMVEMEKKRNSSSSSSSSGANDDVSNPHKRIRCSAGNSGLWMTGRDLPSAAQLLKEQQDVLERDREEAEAEGTSIPCSNCSSKLTYSCNLISYDIGKSEIWGNKDTNDQSKRIQCKECKHVTTIVAES